MTEVPTIKVKRAGTRTGYKIINLSLFDPKRHKPFGPEDRALVGQTDEDVEAIEAREKAEAEKKANANAGQIDGGSAEAPERNTSGTFSTPTPTDIRYPDKLATEFENNLGAHVGASAAELREAAGLADEPGGIVPTVEIPDDWANMHWKQQIALAEKISGQSDLDTATARKRIADEVSRRAAAETREG